MAIEALVMGAASTAGMYLFIVAMQPDNRAKIKAAANTVSKTISEFLANPEGTVSPTRVV